MNKVIFGNHSINTMIALTNEEQSRGLMGSSWPPSVMSFPSEKAAIHKFWMKNTGVPLDIIFCFAGKVVSVEKGIPFSEKHVGPNSLTDLVVELPLGTAEKLKIVPGTPVKLAYDIITLGRKVELFLVKTL